MTTPDPFAPGYRLTDGNQLNDRIANPVWSTTSSISATPGGTMLNSASITDTITNITTASAPGAGVVLPQALLGTVLVVSNNSGNDVRVFAEGDSTIDGLAGVIGIILAKGTTAIFTAVATKEWTWLNTSANAGITTVENIANLRATTVNLYTAALVEAYRTPGDGGGGYFYGVTGAAPGTYVDNGGTIIVPTGGDGSSAWLRVYSGELNVKWFGAYGDLTHDDTAAMTNAHSVGGIVFYPNGRYKFSTLMINQTAFPNGTYPAGGIIGESPSSVQLYQTALGVDGIIYQAIVDAAQGPIFKSFTLSFFPSPVAYQTAGALLRITQAAGVGGTTQGTLVQDVWFYQSYWNGLVMSNQVNYDVVDCHFQNYSGSGMINECPNSTDAGDSTITGCVFGTAIGPTVNPSAQTIGYTQTSGGGIRLVNNKFLGGDYNINVFYTQNTPSADFYIEGNSIEGAQVCSINFNRAIGSTASLGPILIEGNNIGPGDGAYAILCNTTSNVFSVMTISGNSFYMATPNNFAIFLEYVDTVNIVGNIFDAPGGVTTGTGVYLGPHVTYGQVTANYYRRTAAPVNNQSATSIVNEQRQTGTASASTSVSYGSLFAGNGSVTFPIPFSTNPPSVSATVLNANTVGGVSVIVSTITTTGFGVTVLGVTNGQTIPFQWTADGVISVM